MFQSDLFKGKTVLVTGGGSGIGFAIAKKYLQLGAEVVISSRKEEKLKVASDQLNAFGKCRYAVCDIRLPEQTEAVVADILQHEGKLDILINNAGGQFPSPAENISPKGFAAVVNNNLNGTWNITYAAANKIFIPQNSGVIVNIIAQMFRGFPGMAHTGAARAGVENLTKTLAVEWSKYHINVNAIAPGFIQSSGMEQYPEEFKKGMEDVVPAKRLGTVDEVADLTVFLSSPAANYITGETVYIDGGQRLWGDLWKM
ncbi:MAG: SDR family oxidoreductase [Chitinophagales bacterium]|nr:SDR family oxidoreductase [Chitinophagales bacterium]